MLPLMEASLSPPEAHAGQQRSLPPLTVLLKEAPPQESSLTPEPACLQILSTTTEGMPPTALVLHILPMGVLLHLLTPTEGSLDSFRWG